MQVYRLKEGSSVAYARGCKSKLLSKDTCDDFISEVCATVDSRTVRKYIVVYDTYM